MGRVLLQDNIPILTIASTTSVQLAATSMGQPTRITIGGQQYALTSALTLNTGGTGANGLDAGTLGAIQLWYVYAIVNQTTFAVAMVASQTSPSTGPTMPSGYGTSYKLVGAFYTDSTSAVATNVTLTGSTQTSWFSVNTGWSLNGSSNGSAFTNTTFASARAKRNGDSCRFRVEITFSGAPGTGTGALSLILPSQFHADSTKISGTNQPTCGSATVNTASGNYGCVPDFGGVSFGGGGQSYFYFQTGSGVGVTATAPVSLASGSAITVDFVLPIQGWNETIF